MESSALDKLIRMALAEFTLDLRSSVWHGRENELVNWFAHGHLVRVRTGDGVGLHPLQLGIEVAVPQVAGTSRRPHPDVRKDLVVWRLPKQTCWSAPRRHGEPPLAILEWKSLNNVGVRESVRDKRATFEHDVEWLRTATQRFPNLLGYAVFVDLRPATLALTCHFVAGGKATMEDRWIP